MRLGRTLLAVACGAALLGQFPALAESCKEPKTGTNNVTGTGRLQFYSAPNFSCLMDGVFVIPKDKLVAYAQTDDGWSSVMYINPRTGNDVSGWVRSERLKVTGTMGPKQ